MTSIAPVNQRGSAPAVRKDGEWPDHVPAGLFSFYAWGDNPRAGILFGCPCGCGQMMSISIAEGGSGQTWSWNGNEGAPTTTPSILIYQLEEGTGARVGEHWHGYLTDGEFRSC
ncbi:DUF6527 family protein [Novosphingobium sp. AP12]|uniref:DUF6527 family protein n=1 Tax=Novosphingobium sp. AP12 TaxID=1144305 RepID=UPI000271DDEE|nr:DUF6527 family protein [Novosphingobium sp. AP12]EJL21880.1 hypothetical protein PMI02_04865 [Novosphingobium sp. AP12]